MSKGTSLYYLTQAIHFLWSGTKKMALAKWRSWRKVFRFSAKRSQRISIVICQSVKNNSFFKFDPTIFSTFKNFKLCQVNLVIFCHHLHLLDHKSYFHTYIKHFLMIWNLVTLRKKNGFKLFSSQYMTFSYFKGILLTSV